MAMRRSAFFNVATTVAAISVSTAATVIKAEPSKSLIKNVHEVRAALRACWVSPTAPVSRSDIAISVRVSFKHNGEVLGIPLITYTNPVMSEDERQSYRSALVDALTRCAPLPFSDAFGDVMAGHPINMRFH